ncbi:hypothetical protein QF002_001422 [Paraburkholderia youngii]
MVWQSTGQPQRLWPVIPIDERQAFSPTAWCAFNGWAVALIALPYCLVVGCCVGGWMAVSSAHDYALTHTSLGSGVAAVVAGATRCALLVVTVRVEWMMLRMLPWVVREARDCFNEAVST